MVQQYSMHGQMLDLQRDIATSEERNFIEQIKAPLFSEALLAIEIVQELQFKLEEKVNSQHLKKWFFLKNRLIHFTSIAPLLLDQSNETSWVFPALK